MRSDEAITAVAHLRAPWPYQPMSDAERDQWTRALTDPLAHITAEDFDSAVQWFVRKGGSQTAGRPGMRPGLGEVLGAVRARAEARRRGAGGEREEWPEIDPEDVSRRVREIKAEAGIR